MAPRRRPDFGESHSPAGYPPAAPELPASPGVAADLARGLGPLEPRVGHGFARLAASRSDQPVMADMLARERAAARSWVVDNVAGPRVSERADDDRRQLLVVPDAIALVEAGDVTAVGFFGQLRKGVDHTVLFELEATLAETFADYAALGLLSYYDLGAEHGRFGNLVLFSRPDGPELWHANPVHRRAVAVAPAHYQSIRLHRARIPGPFLGVGELHVERTTYLDFRGERLWHAVRIYA